MTSSAGDQSIWLNGARWDRTWLLGTAAVIPFTLALVWGGISSDVLNLVVTLMAGGPHVFSTFLTTYLDPEYRRQHGWGLTAVAVIIPLAVAYLTIHRFQELMSFFIFAASFHVLQQNAYLADAYRRRQGRPEPLWSKVLDYAVLFLSFYPIASYKLVRDDFKLGEVLIGIPGFVKNDTTVVAISVLFAASFLGWTIKSLREWQLGVLNRPKTLLILATSMIAFWIPAMASGTRLELVFQSVNTWHSLQYLGLTWLVLKIRKTQGRTSSAFLTRISGEGKSTWSFYGLCIVFTTAQLLVIFTLKLTDPFRLTGIQYQYMGVFSVLFIHYAYDGYFFFAARGESATPENVPFVLPVRTVPEGAR
ncbi:MAG TPA: hypothetical protein VKW04_16225 [Planctomycetota bacterium]|nr:hypothetical protein [Planctomycetota bacterium]